MATSEELNQLVCQHISSLPNGVKLTAGIIPVSISTSYRSPATESIPLVASPFIQELQRISTSIRAQALPDKPTTLLQQRVAHWRKEAEYEQWVLPLYLYLENVNWDKVLEQQRARWQREYVLGARYGKERGYRRIGTYYGPKEKSARLIQRDQLLPGTGYRMQMELPIRTPVEDAQRGLDKALALYRQAFANRDMQQQAVTADHRRYLAVRLRTASIHLGRYDRQQWRPAVWEPDYSLKILLEPSKSHPFGQPPSSHGVGELLAKVEYFWRCWQDFTEAEELNGSSPVSISEATSLASLKHEEVNSDLDSLHPSVQQAASRLFKDKHYRQAILDAYIALDKAVQTKAKQPSALTGKVLMETVFSPKRPVLSLSDDQNERHGYMSLFSGAVQAIRNHYAHNLTELKDAQEAMEWLSYASALFRKVDEAQFVPNKP